MKLQDFEFGFADATKEYSRTPEIIKKAFCDPRGIFSKLINSYPYILVGPKGSGKSAYCAKIQLESDHNNFLFSYSINLCDFEFTTFAKTGIDEDVTGTQRYKSSWDFLFLWTIFKKLYSDLCMVENEQIITIIDTLEKLGFSVQDGYKADVTKLSKLKIGTNIKIFDIEFEKEFQTKPASFLERLSIMSENMMNVLSGIYLNEREVILLIDGLDDVLRYRKNRMDIIASMVRSADYINDYMIKSQKKIKIILLMREDIIKMINDPDINKIIQDGSVYLNWHKRLDDLKELINLRFAMSGISYEEASECWDKLFPAKIRNKKSWAYILDYTLYKPRDVLQFLKYCQSEYPNAEKLTLSETQNVLKIYSNKYFIEEMKNELSGFIDDEIIISIPSVFRRLGGRPFDISELNRLTNEQISKEVSIAETKEQLLYLFEAGYVGQLISNGKGQKQSVVFKYRNPTARIDYYQKFITHRGLHSGLGVR